MEQLAGTVDSVIFRSGNGGFTVFRLQLPHGAGMATVTGHVPAPFAGEELEIDGEWVEHPRFGRQFRAASCRKLPFQSNAGIERFLASGVVKGVGAALAARLVERFGADTLNVLETEPQKLAVLPGIGIKRADMIGASYAAIAGLRELMLFLETHGLSGNWAEKLAAVYGADAVEIIGANPYRLCAEIDGIGFRTADRLGLSLGLEPADLRRMTAGVDYALSGIAQSGHCCIPETELVTEAARLLGVDSDEVSFCLADMLRQGRLAAEDIGAQMLIYPEYLYRAEVTVAGRLKDLLAKTRLLATDGLAAATPELAMLAPDQLRAVQSALEHGVMVLTGGPGTGKTTTIKGILAAFLDAGLKVCLAAPTGRAAKRLSEATGAEAATVHRLLEASALPGGGHAFGKNEEAPVKADAIIVDEVSMMDMVLMAHLLAAVPDGCRLVLAGDVDQLPAVGPGAVLKDIIRSETAPVVRLTEIFRQAETSVIIRNAHRINRGQLPDLDSCLDFCFEDIGSEEETARRIVELCRDELPAGGYRTLGDVQVLSPMHRLDCGVENLNCLLQAALNPPHPERAELTAGQAIFREGDKVMQVRNHYGKGVFNGDVGFIAAITENEIRVAYPEGDVAYAREEIDQITLAYALSVHKSQGSEYPAVVMPLVAGHRIMMQRSLLYTAVTRARERVILLGAKKALSAAVANDRTRRRYSLLAERLRGGELC